MKKKELRKEFLAKRNSLSSDNCLRLSEGIVNQFRHINLPKVAFALSYIPIIAKNEFDPAKIELALLKHHPSYKLCYPKIKLDENSMEAIAYIQGTAMIDNELGIKEPVSGNIVDPKRIDVIIVPLLCFDKRGYRVGYGKGFYDRYILRCRLDVVTIGISFFDPVETINDIDEYDVPLKYCVTPQLLYQFN